MAIKSRQLLIVVNFRGFPTLFRKTKEKESRVSALAREGERRLAEAEERILGAAPIFDRLVHEAKRSLLITDTRGVVESGDRSCARNRSRAGA